LEQKFLQVDLTVIGGGPAGYSAALRGSQLSRSILLIEKEEIGGSCLNKGCIPSKLLLESTDSINYFRKIVDLGIKINNNRLDMKNIRLRNERIIKKMVTRMQSNLEQSGIIVFRGQARLINSHLVSIENIDFQFTVVSRSVVVATGSRPLIPSIQGINNAITTDYLRELNRL
jgi:dihydrolipoamide dehydrogenase